MDIMMCWIPRRRSCRTLAFTLAALLGVGCLAPIASAQHEVNLPPRNKRPVRPSVLNLEQQAKQPRPGQVLPLDERLEAEEAQTLAPASASAPAAAPAVSPVRPALQPPAGMTTPPAAAAADTPRRPAVASSFRPGAAVAVPAGDPIHAAVVRAEGGEAQAQWRLLDGNDDESGWMPLQTGDVLHGRIEVRTALAGAVTLELGGVGGPESAGTDAVIQIERLSRMRFEKRAGQAQAELVISLDRGLAHVTPRDVDALGLARTPLRIITPDSSLLRKVATSVRYDAFTGTRENLLIRD